MPDSPTVGDAAKVADQLHGALEYARGQEVSGRHDWCDDEPILAALEAHRRLCVAIRDASRPAVGDARAVLKELRVCIEDGIDGEENVAEALRIIDCGLSQPVLRESSPPEPPAQIELTEAEFQALPTYTCSRPTSPKVGFRFKTNNSGQGSPRHASMTAERWWLGEVCDDPEPGYVQTKYVRIVPAAKQVSAPPEPDARTRLERLMADLTAEGSSRCCYAPGCISAEEWVTSRCDCKYWNPILKPAGEETGCCEMRAAYRVLAEALSSSTLHLPVRERARMVEPKATGPDRPALRKVISLIASADYELGCAAAEAEKGGALSVGAECAKLMLACVNLREGIARQIAEPASTSEGERDA